MPDHAVIDADLNRAKVEVVEAHLLDCDRCGHAVYVAEAMRELAPALRDRVRMNVETACGGTAAHAPAAAVPPDSPWPSFRAWATRGPTPVVPA